MIGKRKATHKRPKKKTRIQERKEWLERIKQGYLEAY